MGGLIAPILTLIMVMGLASAPRAAAFEPQEVWSDKEIIVKSKLGGPVMWKIKKGDSTVWVLGVLPDLPRSQKWDKKRISRAIKGANELILPPQIAVGIGDFFKAMSAKNLPKPQTLQSVVSPNIYARYTELSQKTGVPIKAFEHDKPVWAGVRFRADVLKKLKLNEHEPQDSVVSLATSEGVAIKKSAVYHLAPLMKDLNNMSLENSQACLSYTLDDIDYAMNRGQIAAQAWANGDLKTVRANYIGSNLSSCLEGSEKGSAFLDRSVDDTVGAIQEALTHSGKTVAIFSLASLLRKDGALDRLRAKGYEITNPEP